MLAEEAFKRLYPDRANKWDFKIMYSGKFNDFNSNVRFSRINNKVEFNLSKKWKEIDEEIQIGLIQSLMVKIFKEPGKTTNIGIYNSFIKNLHLGIAKEQSDPLLEDSFERINKKYFYGLVEKPNLVWGSLSYRKLGSYDFHTDTILISRALMDKEASLLDYVMYHEMLHKKEKFESKNGRTHHHTHSFRKKERQFENSEEIERKLRYLGSGRFESGFRKTGNASGKGFFRWF